jgi:hypothetical protein
VGLVNENSLTKYEVLSRFLQMEERIDELKIELKRKSKWIEEFKTRL